MPAGIGYLLKVRRIFLKLNLFGVFMCPATIISSDKSFRLRLLRQLARLKQKDMAHVAGVSLSTYKSWESGKHNELPEKRAIFFIPALQAEGIGCSLEWLMTGVGDEPCKKYAVEPLTHRELVLNETKSEYQKIHEELDVFRKNHINSLDLFINDEAMAPYVKKGDHVAGVKLLQKHFKKAIGENCIVQLKSGVILARQVHDGSKPNYYHLLNINTQCQPAIIHDIELIAIAPIIFLRKNCF